MAPPLPETAPDTLRLARTLSGRLAEGDVAEGSSLPELLAVVRQIGRRAADRAAGGDPAFAPIAARARAWEPDGCLYADAVRLAVDYVARLDVLPSAEGTASAGEYRLRVAAEFDDALALFPTVILLPSFEALGMIDLLRLRATPVRVLGLLEEPRLADGGLCTPQEFFWHDFDHMRFMVREDLAALGVDIPDAYGPPDAAGRQSTFDAATGRHRRILQNAAAPLASRHDEHGKLMARGAHTLDALLHALEETELDDTRLAAAARWTLFEICHEKSSTPVPEVLGRELSHGRHLAKIRFKLARRFWGDDVDPVLADHLAPARDLLLQLLSDSPEAC